MTLLAAEVTNPLHRTVVLSQGQVQRHAHPDVVRKFSWPNVAAGRRGKGGGGEWEVRGCNIIDSTTQ
jgi:hypothetical protein